MQIEVRIDSTCTEPKIIVLTDSMTEEVAAVVKLLSKETPHMIAGFAEDTVSILDQADIVRFYSAGGKIIAETESGEYVIRLRLYELEDRLDNRRFVRISNSEIINLKKVRGFDLSFSGTICVSMQNGTVTYVSRRYVAKIKQVLGI